MIDNNKSHKWSNINTFDVDNGSKKKTTTKIANIINDYFADSNEVGQLKGSTDSATRQLSENIEQATKVVVCEFQEIKKPKAKAIRELMCCAFFFIVGLSSNIEFLKKRGFFVVKYIAFNT
jgi:hypothetical protein